MPAEQVTAITSEEWARLNAALADPSDPVAGAAEIQLGRPEVTWRSTGVQPFAPTYVGPDQHGVVHMRNATPGGAVRVLLRLQTPGGAFLSIDRTFYPAAGVDVLEVIPLREGWLYGIVVATSQVPIHTPVFVRVGIQQGLAPGQTVLNWWLSDAVFDGYQTSWPTPRYLDPKSALGATDYRVWQLDTTDVESLPVVFGATSRRIDVWVFTNPALLRLLRVDGTKGDPIRLEAGSQYRIDGGFTGFTGQNASAGLNATVRVVAWW